MKYKSDYKPTGNIAVDMVGAAISHYRKQRFLPEYIRLSPKYWAMFMTYVLTHSPECFSTDYIDFDNVKVCKGSQFQKEHVEFEFKTAMA